MKATGCLVSLIVLGMVIAIGMVFSALAIGAANAWFLSGNFSDGWSLAWQKPFVLFGWGFLFMGGVGGASSSRRS